MSRYESIVPAQKKAGHLGRLKKQLTTEVFGSVELELAPRHVVQPAGVQFRHLPVIAGAPVSDGSRALEIELSG